MSTAMDTRPVPFADLPADEQVRIVDELLAPAAERARRYEEWRRSPLAKRYTDDEAGRRGQELYDQVVRPTLAPVDDGRFVVIDLETGEYELDHDESKAFDRLTARVSAFQVWTGRAGFVATMMPRIGWMRA